MKHLLSVWIVIILATGGCEKASNPVDSTPESGVQSFIPWPSLANTPWPMNHHDSQSTGRSPYKGPREGMIEHISANVRPYASFITGFDTIVIGGVDLFFLNSDLTQRNVVIAPTPLSTPILRSDSIIVGMGASAIFTVSHHGQWLWGFNIGESAESQSLGFGKDGTVYGLTFQQTLWAVDRNGSVLFKQTDPRFGKSSRSAFAFSTDGKILYFTGIGSSALIAFDVEAHQVLWTFGRTHSQQNSTAIVGPMVDNAGHIYVMGASDTTSDWKPAFFCLNPDGGVRWKYVHNTQFESVMAGDPCIDHNGNSYFATDSLYSFDYHGNLRWKRSLGYLVDSPLICDADGVVYVVHLRGRDGASAYSTDGTELWHVTLPDNQYYDASPLITVHNRLIVVGSVNVISIK